MNKIFLISLMLIVPFAAYTATASSAKAKNVTNPKIEATVVVDDSYMYYPGHVGNILYLKGRRKKNPEKLLYVKAETKAIEQRDGKDYHYFYAPQVDIRYLINIDKENGIAMKIIKYPFPFFDMSIEVTLTPEMTFMKFPLVVGNKWTYVGRGEATLLGFIKVGRDLKTDFEVVSKETIKTEAGDFEAYNIVANVDEGDGKGVHSEKYWYAKGLGYTIAETSGHRADLAGYKIFDETTGIWKEKLPEGVDKYE
ncbi:MAG: hypothetical protein WCJ94_00485 [bacterium]